MQINLTPEELIKIVMGEAGRPDAEKTLQHALNQSNNDKAELKNKLQLLEKRFELIKRDNECLGKNTGELAAKIGDLNNIAATNQHYIEIMLKDWNSRKGNRKLVYKDGLIREA